MKKNYHYHVCSCGSGKPHTWKHEGKCYSQLSANQKKRRIAPDCNLSHAAHCGFKVANDMPFCVVGRNLSAIKPPEPAEQLKKYINKRIKGRVSEGRYFFEADAFGIDRATAEKVLNEEVAKIDARQLVKLEKLARKVVKGKLTKSDYFAEAFKLKFAEDQAANVLRKLQPKPKKDTGKLKRKFVAAVKRAMGERKLTKKTKRGKVKA